MRMKALVALADGTVFEGRALGSGGECLGEMVFNTSMTGYQEILTDPSYRGQIVAMTYPLIGNYGICPEDMESPASHVSGFVVRELAHTHSNFRADQSLHDWLRQQNIIALSNIDTRALTRKIRCQGAMKSAISTEILDDHELVEMARASAGLVGQDLVCEVTGSSLHVWKSGYDSAFAGPRNHRTKDDEPRDRPRVVAIDCGMKRNISRNLVEAGLDLTIVPASATTDEILACAPDGIFVSNGPGDPKPVAYTIDTLCQLLKREIPTFGICLGMQLLCLALGGKTYKLKFGHRGTNQPVMNLDTGRVEITAQNHGFAVDSNSLIPDKIRITHVNLNDNTLEGIAHKHLPLFAVQYHPEASPGPHDGNYLFRAFYEMVRSGKTLQTIRA